MEFANPQTLWLFLLITGALYVHLRSGGKRDAALERFARDETRPHLLPPRDRGLKSARAFLLFAALVLCTVAALRPQGEPYREAQKGEGVDILVALDTSKSMLADDVRPSRLAAAKGAIEQLTTSLRGDRIGLILFAGSSFLACPLTTDYGAFIEVLREVDVQAIPRGGTSLTTALDGAVKGFRGVDGKSRILLIVSDGEEQEGDVQKSLPTVRTAGITVFAAGVGTAQGGLIPLKGRGQWYVKDRQGNVVKSSLDTAALRGIAEATGGTMVTIEESSSLARLYRERLSTMPKREVSAGMRRQYREWFQIPLGIACILLFLELLAAARSRAW
jgi:Ca-activated chloride channel family protein